MDRRVKPMAYTLREYREAIDSGRSHSVANTATRTLSGTRKRGPQGTEDRGRRGKPLDVLQKQDGRADLKFDAAMASVLSWKACLDARKSGLDRQGRSECHVASTERVVHDSGDAGRMAPVLTAVWMLRSRESVCCVATLTATPAPEMGKNVRASWQRFQRQSRVNLATKISSSLAERLIPTVLMLAPTPTVMWWLRRKGSGAITASKVWSLRKPPITC
ncbi:hypothetical protein SAMN04488548_13225 [Gordonia westfalica]|uniref:Uncharacterized protein n=1 Tax=Gordonia westfalica TaxID=158898 RepID=A0A1H2EJV9_9ACTN|nr:hypothetical protein SAMN04488548_13225 [Gordonia westfalica]